MEIAAGERLPFTQDEVAWRGSAIECRIYAEDPYNDFLPYPGKITRLSRPHGPGHSPGWLRLRWLDRPDGIRSAAGQTRRVGGHARTCHGAHDPRAARNTMWAASTRIWRSSARFWKTPNSARPSSTRDSSTNSSSAGRRMSLRPIWLPWLHWSPRFTAQGASRRPSNGTGAGCEPVANRGPRRVAAMKLALTIDGRADTIEILAPAPACRFQLGDGGAARCERGEPRARRVFGAAGWPQLRCVRRRHAGRPGGDDRRAPL